MIPDEEKVKNRNFIIDKGDLCYRGDRSWFVIKNYISCNEMLEMTYSDIQIVDSLYRKTDEPGQFRMERENEYSVLFCNSQQSIEMAPRIIDTAPEFDIKEDHEYSAIDNIIKDGIKLFDMKDEFSSIDSYVDNGIAYFALISSKGTAMISGTEVMDMDMKYSSNIIKPAVHAEATYRVAKDGTICFMFKPKDNSGIGNTYISTLFRESSLLEKQRNIIRYAGTEEIEKNEVDDIVTMVVSVPDFIGIFPTINKLEFSNYLTMQVVNNCLSISITDISRRKFNANMECKSDENISFTCRNIDMAAISFLMGQENYLDTDVLRLTVNTTKRVMIIRLLNAQLEKKNSALLLRMISTGANKWSGNQEK